MSDYRDPMFGYDPEFEVVERLPAWTAQLSLAEIAKLRERGILADPPATGPTAVEKWRAAQEDGSVRDASHDRLPPFGDDPESKIVNPTATREDT